MAGTEHASPGDGAAPATPPAPKEDSQSSKWGFYSAVVGAVATVVIAVIAAIWKSEPPKPVTPVPPELPVSHTYRGTVKDYETKDPINDVQVSIWISDTSLAPHTDSAGNFQFEFPATGTVSCRVSVHPDGYQEESQVLSIGPTPSNPFVELRPKKLLAAAPPAKPREAAPILTQVTHGNGTATLVWNGSADRFYNVKRSLEKGKGYQPIVSGLHQNSYSDLGLSNGLTYYYVVTAGRGAEESEFSNEVGVIPSAPNRVFVPPPPAPPPALLNSVTITFRTTNDDKDHDTRVTITIFDTAGHALGAVAGTFGRFPDNSSSGPIALNVAIGAPKERCQHGKLHIRIDPVGNDTWNFNYHLEFHFSDGSVVSNDRQGVSLSQKSRDMDGGW